jgi:hypothetical protein
MVEQSRRAADYRLRAERAEQMATECRDPEARRSYEEIARNWREMAEQAERRGW